MRRVAALFLLVVLCLSLCACTPGGPVVTAPSPEPTPTPSQQPLRQQGLALAYDPNASLHPITGDSEVNRLLSPLIYEGLFRLDGSFTPQPVLAADAAADDTGLRWTITLRTGVLFSDGTPLTAEHVADSLDQARKSAVYKGRLSGIATIKAAEDGVVITLREPNQNLPALLDIPIVLEREGAPAPLGTGRYRYAGEGEELCLLVNYNRAGQLPYDTISLTPVTGGAQRMSAFDSGMVTAVVTQPAAPGALSYGCSYESWDYTTTELLYVGFRTGEDTPCGEALVRRAIAGAFDRTKLVEEHLMGYGDPTALPIPTCHQDWEEAANAAADCGPEAAADLLARAGYAMGEDGLLYRERKALALTLLVNSDNQGKVALAHDLAASLEALGMTVQVNALPWKGYLAALEAGKFDLYLGETRMTGDFDLTALLAGELNYGGYGSERFDQLLAAWKAGELSRGSLLRVVSQNAPIAPLCFRKESLLVRWGAVSDLAPICGDIFNDMEHWIPGTE